MKVLTSERSRMPNGGARSTSRLWARKSWVKTVMSERSSSADGGGDVGETGDGGDDLGVLVDDLEDAALGDGAVVDEGVELPV
jgi:hypothetical protein